MRILLLTDTFKLLEAGSTSEKPNFGKWPDQIIIKRESPKTSFMTQLAREGMGAELKESDLWGFLILLCVSTKLDPYPHPLTDSAKVEVMAGGK